MRMHHTKTSTSARVRRNVNGKKTLKDIWRHVDTHPVTARFTHAAAEAHIKIKRT